MLQIKDVKKSYKTGDFVQVALNGVNLNFRDNEFVAILGPSGSGKTTLLNIIGGLDHYDTGDLVIDGVSTKEYKDRDWDTYRNNRIGFVFQSYNLIPHQTVLANVELALTLSGVSREERHKRALEALEKVGLADHVNKRPSQMSGGQMQRVAIARALINNPEILLADEPTGALDSKTSVQIMDLLTEIAKDRLVVMVTHNPELAEQYATRIVTLADGNIRGDTNPYDPAPEDFRKSDKKIRRASMSFFTALALSFNNLMTKKGRTIMTAFAGSIGIIGIAAILSLSTGVNAYIDSIEEETLSEYPVTISSSGFSMTTLFTGMAGDASNSSKENDDSSVSVRGVVSNITESVGDNDLKSLKAFLDSDESGITSCTKAVEYSYGITPQIYNSDTSGKIHQANPNTAVSAMYSSSAASMMSSASSSMSSNIFDQLPSDESLYKDSYDVVAGHWPENANEVVLVTSQTGATTDFVLYTMGLLDPDELSDALKGLMNGEKTEVSESPSSVSYDEIMGVTFKLVNKADCYQRDDEYGVWIDKSDDEDYMKDLINNGETLTVCGIVQEKEDANAGMLSVGLAYSPELTEKIISYAQNSAIVQEQLANPDVDVFSGKTFDEEEDESGSSFDMSSLFSFDTDSLTSMFSGLSADSFDLSSLDLSSIDLSDIDLSDIDLSDIEMPTLDFSDVPTVDLSSILSDADLQKVKVDPSAFSDILNNELAAYVGYWQQEAAAGHDRPSIEKFMQTDTATQIMNTGLAKAVDTSQLSAADAVAVQQRVQEALSPYLTKKFARTMKDVVEDFVDQVSDVATEVGEELMSSVGSSLSSSMSSVFSSMFSFDSSSMSDLFQSNMDETTLSELMSSMMSTETKTLKTNLKTLAYADYDDPSGISIYPTDFEAKEKVISILDGYNDRMEEAGEDDKVITYTDMVGALMSSVTTIINAITTMLIAFVAISLVVSSIMIGIITYISVLERKKEIGILRALGASKRNVSQVFNAETIIVGLLAGLIGVGLTGIACFPVSAIVNITMDVPNVMQLPIMAGVILVCISVLLTFIGGLIPANSASHKDPVEALRSE